MEGLKLDVVHDRGDALLLFSDVWPDKRTLLGGMSSRKCRSEVGTFRELNLNPTAPPP